MDWEEGKKYEKKDFRKLYEDLVKSDWFKKAYNNKSLGECPLDFPELAESEDEKVRKEIIDFIQWAEDREMTRHDYHQAKRPAVWLAYLEKQKEQKPKNILTDDDSLSTAYNKGVTDVVEDPEAYGLCKPAEWSEENDEAYKFVTALINSLVWRKDWVISKAKCLKMLKSLRPQPKQKWSEEDTDMYINVASSLRGYACGLENEKHKRHIQKELDWLENHFKSLSPQYHEDFFKEGIGHYFFDGEKTHFCGSPAMETNENCISKELDKNI